MKRIFEGTIMKKMLKILTMLLVIAAVVFAAGCADKSENVIENNTTENNTTQANETVVTGQVVTEADNGTSISLKNGDNFTLQLWENPSTGYLLGTQPERGAQYSR